MKPANVRRCLSCEAPFDADRRNAYHQKYCSAPACQKVSKTASQRAWSTKQENLAYHCGAGAVARVQAWQAQHPQYRARQKAQRAAALQDLCDAQVPETKQEIEIASNPVEIAGPALQDFIHTQPLVFIGLIAHFFNITLQDQMELTTNRLQQLGEDIVNGRGPDGYAKAGGLSGTVASRAGAVQLGGSTPGTG